MADGGLIPLSRLVHIFQTINEQHPSYAVTGSCVEGYLRRRRKSPVAISTPIPPLGDLFGDATDVAHAVRTLGDVYTEVNPQSNRSFTFSDAWRQLCEIVWAAGPQSLYAYQSETDAERERGVLAALAAHYSTGLRQLLRTDPLRGSSPRLQLDVKRAPLPHHLRMLLLGTDERGGGGSPMPGTFAAAPVVPKPPDGCAGSRKGRNPLGAFGTSPVSTVFAAAPSPVPKSPRRGGGLAAARRQPNDDPPPKVLGYLDGERAVKAQMMAMEEKLQHLLTEERRVSAGLRQDIRQLQRDLRHQSERAERQFQTTGSERHQLQGRLANLEADGERMATECTHLRSDLAAKTNEVVRLQHCLAQEETSVSHLRRQLQLTRAEFDAERVTTDEAHDTLLAEVTSHSTALGDTGRQLAETQRLLEASRKAHEADKAAWCSERDALNSRVSTLQATNTEVCGLIDGMLQDFEGHPRHRQVRERVQAQCGAPWVAALGNTTVSADFLAQWIAALGDALVGCTLRDFVGGLGCPGNYIRLLNTLSPYHLSDERMGELRLQSPEVQAAAALEALRACGVPSMYLTIPEMLSKTSERQHHLVLGTLFLRFCDPTLVGIHQDRGVFGDYIQYGGAHASPQELRRRYAFVAEEWRKWRRAGETQMQVAVGRFCDAARNGRCLRCGEECGCMEVQRIREADDFVVECQQCLQEGDYHKAMALAERALQWNPNHVKAYLQRAVATLHITSGVQCTEDVLRDSRRALELLGDDESNEPALSGLAHHVAGDAHYRAHHFASALVSYTAAVERHHAPLTLYTNRGLAYVHTGQPTLAVADLLRLWKEDVPPGPSLLREGITSLRTLLPDEQRAQLQRLRDILISLPPLSTTSVNGTRTVRFASLTPSDASSTALPSLVSKHSAKPSKRRSREPSIEMESGHHLDVKHNALTMEAAVISNIATQLTQLPLVGVRVVVMCAKKRLDAAEARALEIGDKIITQAMQHVPSYLPEDVTSRVECVAVCMPRDVVAWDAFLLPIYGDPDADVDVHKQQQQSTTDTPKKKKKSSSSKFT